MGKEEDAFNFFNDNKSTKAAVENFIDMFQSAYEGLEGKQQILLSQCIQQMFRKYYYCELICDTIFTPANIINTLAERQFGRDTMVFPMIRTQCLNKKIRRIELKTLSFGLDNHYFIKDMQFFLRFASKGIPLDKQGILDDDSRGNLGENFAIDDRHYVNIISMAAFEMGLLEKVLSIKGNIYIPGGKADEFLSMENRDKLMMAVDALISICSHSIAREFPKFKEEFSVQSLMELLKKPRLYDTLLKGLMKRMGIDVNGLKKQLLEMDPDSVPEFSEDEMLDFRNLFTIQALMDMYFIVPFGYYLQLIQPIYPGIYDIEAETMNIIQYVDSFLQARNSLFYSIGCDYDLTPLGEQMLLDGKRPRRRQALLKSMNDNDMYNIIIDSKEYAQMEDDWDDEDYIIESKVYTPPGKNVIDFNDYKNKTENKKLCKHRKDSDPD